MRCIHVEISDMVFIDNCIVKQIIVHFLSHDICLLTFFLLLKTLDLTIVESSKPTYRKIYLESKLNGRFMFSSLYFSYCDLFLVNFAFFFLVLFSVSYSMNAQIKLSFRTIHLIFYRCKSISSLYFLH